ncbi:MAG: phosphatidylinositol 4-kinase [Spirochaetaceae bacterium]|nr:phosphatidylinositol 4-kinase [Spirochaetaceae bacterium]
MNGNIKVGSVVGVLEPLVGVEYGQPSNNIFKGKVKLLDKTETICFIKLLPSNKELAIELFCAKLANNLNLQVPQPILIAIGKNRHSSIRTNCYAYGYEWLTSIPFASKIGKLPIGHPSVPPMAIFDELILNDDRHYGNILIENKDNKIRHYIDHEQALQINSLSHYFEAINRNWLVKELIEHKAIELSTLFARSNFYDNLSDSLYNEVTRGIASLVNTCFDECSEVFRKAKLSVVDFTGERDFLINRGGQLKDVVAKQIEKRGKEKK